MLRGGVCPIRNIPRVLLLCPLADIFRGDADDEDQVADSYVLDGVDSATANMFAARVGRSSKNPNGLSQPETFFEVFG